MLAIDPMDWTWSDNAGATPPASGQVPRASRYRTGYRVSDIVRVLLLMVGG